MLYEVITGAFHQAHRSVPAKQCHARIGRQDIVAEQRGHEFEEGPGQQGPGQEETQALDLGGGFRGDRRAAQPFSYNFV